MMSAREFAEAVQSFDWSRRVWRVDVQASHGAMGPGGMRTGIPCGASEPAHVVIARDGTIRSLRDWNSAPFGIGRSVGVGAFTVEVAGSFDHGQDRLEGDQWDSLIAAIDAVQRRFELPVHALLFHRELPHLETTCPGSGIEKGEVLQALRLERRRPLPVAAEGRLAIGA